jgi:hypothetical protein
MKKKTKPVKRRPTTAEILASGSVGRRADTAARKLYARLAALALVERLALSWINDGARGDEPGSAKEAFELLVKHGYTLSSTRTLLYRSDGSEVTR